HEVGPHFRVENNVNGFVQTTTDGHSNRVLQAQERQFASAIVDHVGFPQVVDRCINVEQDARVGEDFVDTRHFISISGVEINVEGGRNSHDERMQGGDTSR